MRNGGFLIAVFVFAVLFLSGSAASDDGYVLVAEYLFNEGEGSVVKDTSGNEYHGTAYHGDTEQGAWIAGREEGTALYFDGENAYVELPNAVLAGPPQAGAIEFWMKPERAEGQVFSQYTSGWGGMWVELRSGRAVRLTMQGDRHTSNTTTRMGNYNLGEWTSIRIEWDKNEGNKIFVDSALRAVSGPIIWRRGISTSIGSRTMQDRAPSRFYRGAIDELRIYHKTETGDE